MYTGNVNAGGEILTASESEGVVPLSLLKFFVDVWVLRDMLYSPGLNF